MIRNKKLYRLIRNFDPYKEDNQCKEGLIIFPNHSSQTFDLDSGYFITDLESLHNCLRYSTKIGDVEIPEDAVFSKLCRYFYRADKIILSNIRPLSEEETISLLNAGADVDIYAAGHFLEFSALHNFVRAIKFLFKRWPELAQHAEYGGRALHIASEAGNIELVKLLLEYGVDVCAFGNQALSNALWNKHMEIAKLLMENGCNINACNAELFLSCVDYDKEWFMKLFTRYNVDICADNSGILLCTMAEHSDVETVKFLLDNGADIHADDDAALRCAARSGNVQTAKFLLDNGADIHAKKESALINAVECDNPEMVQFLLDNGANINIIDGKPLRQAIRKNYPSIVRVLLDNGARIHTCHEEPLRIAAVNQCFDVIPLLLERGANKDIAIDYLRSRGNNRPSKIGVATLNKFK